MTEPFVSPSSRSAVSVIQRLVGIVGGAVDALSNPLMTLTSVATWIATHAVTTPTTLDGHQILVQDGCSPAATAANPPITQSACTSAPSAADGDQLINQGDCDTPATAANPVLSVGGLAARTMGGAAPAAGNLLCTQDNHPRTCRLDTWATTTAAPGTHSRQITHAVVDTTRTLVRTLRSVAYQAAAAASGTVKVQTDDLGAGVVDCTPSFSIPQGTYVRIDAAVTAAVAAATTFRWHLTSGQVGTSLKVLGGDFEEVY